MKIKGLRSPFQLLNEERLKIINQELKARLSKDVNPHLTWTVNGLNNCFYKQSSIFQI